MASPQPTKLNRKFRREYNRIFEKDPVAANLFLLLAELAGPDGTVTFPGGPREMSQELSDLLQARFEDPYARQI